MQRIMEFTCTLVSLVVAVSQPQPSFALQQTAVSLVLTPNEDMIVPHNPGSFTEFRCTVNETDVVLQWGVNRTFSTSNPSADRGAITTGPLEIAEGVLESTFKFPSDRENNNTLVGCRAITNGSPPFVVNSTLVVLRIQGLLDSPPNTTILESRNGSVRTLSWDAPATLDITGVDPDIQHYQICYNQTADDQVCVNISSSGKREFNFPNVAVTLLLTVRAVNVVGLGNTSSAVHNACDGKVTTILALLSKHLKIIIHSTSWC